MLRHGRVNRRQSSDPNLASGCLAKIRLSGTIEGRSCLSLSFLGVSAPTLLQPCLVSHWGLRQRSAPSSGFSLGGTGHKGTRGPSPALRGCTIRAVSALPCSLALSFVPSIRIFAVPSRESWGSTGQRLGEPGEAAQRSPPSSPSHIGLYLLKEAS